MQKASHTSTQYASIVKKKTWTELDTTVYSASGVALLSSKEAQKPTKIEEDTMGAEVMQALWGK